MNTRIEYLYRDAGNFKQFASVVLAGEITPEERSRIAATLDHGEYFIPHQVGLEDLQAKMPSPPSLDLDHVWHELDVESGISLTNEDPTTDVNIHALAGAFTGTWDVNAAAKRLFHR